MGLCQGGVSIGDASAHLFSFVSFLVRSESPVSSSRPAPRLPLARTETVKVGRRTNPFRQAPPLPGHTLTASSTTARLVGDRDDDQRGARVRARSIAPQPCIRWVQGPEP